MCDPSSLLKLMPTRWRLSLFQILFVCALQRGCYRACIDCLLNYMSLITGPAITSL